MSRNNSDTVVAPAMISVIYRDEPDGGPDLLRGRILQLDRQFREWIGPEWHEKRKDPQAAEDFKQLLGSMDTKLTGDPRYLDWPSHSKVKGRPYLHTFDFRAILA